MPRKVDLVMLRRAVQALMAGCLILLCGSSAAPTNAAASHGFSVSGGRILDPGGRVFVAHGVNVQGGGWVWPEDVASQAAAITDCWGFNLVRVNNLLWPSKSQSPTYRDNNNLDRIVSAFTQRKTVVMLEIHDRTGSYFTGKELSSLSYWWQSVARRYAGNPYVWFNIANEPGSNVNAKPSATWLSMHTAVIKSIRATGAKNLIVVDGASWGQDTGTWSTAAVPSSLSALLTYGPRLKSLGNVAVSFHAYDQWNYGDARMAGFVDRLTRAGLPVVVGEYGSHNNVSTLPATRSLLKVAATRPIGRVVWSWFGGDDNDLTTTGNGGGRYVNSCTSPTNLSPLGRLVWADNTVSRKNSSLLS